MQTENFTYKTFASVTRTPAFSFLSKFIQLDEKIDDFVKKNDDGSLTDYLFEIFSQNVGDDNFISYFVNILNIYSAIRPKKQLIFQDIVPTLLYQFEALKDTVNQKTRLFQRLSKNIIKKFNSNFLEFSFISDLKLFSLQCINIEDEKLFNAIKDDNEFILKELSTNLNFDYNKSITFQVDPMFSNISFSRQLNLLNLAALYGSIKCFKLLKINGSVYDENIQEASIIGGNLEIIQQCVQDEKSFDYQFSTSIKFHHNEISDWLLANYKCEDMIIHKPLVYLNFRALLFLSLNECYRKIDLDNTIIVPSKTFNDLFEFPYEVQKALMANDLVPNVKTLIDKIQKDDDIDIKYLENIIKHQVGINDRYYIDKSKTKPTNLLTEILIHLQHLNLKEIMELLVTNGLDINSFIHLKGNDSYYKKPVLLYLCQQINDIDLNILRILLTDNNGNSNPQMYNPTYDYNPLYILINTYPKTKNVVNAIKILLNNGANPNQNFGPQPPLFYILHEIPINYEILEALISHGADVNHISFHQETPLFVACSQHDLTAISLLLEHGASPDEKTIEYSKQDGNEDVRQFFVKTGIIV